MDFRNTHIRTFTGQDIFLPNALIIKNPLINYTRDGLLRHDFTIGIDYDDDTTGAIEAIMDELNDNKHIVHDGDLAPFVVIQEFGTSTINLKVHFWINTNDFLGSITVLKSKIMAKVFLRLKSEGYYMPADIVELKIYQDGNPIPLSIKRSELEEGA
jgi:small-conductance mechanosensitive channel